MFNRKRLFWATTAIVGTLASAGAASAQSTGTEAVEVGEVVVTGARGPRTIDGVIVAETVGKSRSTITQEYIQTQAAGQTINETLNLVPGMVFTNNDPYGSSGGNIRLHGFDGNRIAQTFDGMPLNDSGNYSLYTNQMLDSELIERATVNTGTTDADSPSASATGGTINISSLTPTTDFGGWVQGSLGDFNFRRAMALVNTGEFGPWGTRAWFAYSDQSYDKFKGIGDLHKTQYNAKIYQPIRDNGDFVSLAAHWNRNRNNNYNGPNLFRNADGSLGSTADTSPFGWNVDFNPTYNAIPVTAGVRDDDTNSSNYWGLRVNPSDTGNLRGQSRFTLAKGLIFTFDPSFQYVLANGGSQQTQLNEYDPLLQGAGLTGGVDLNGDGDILDRVRVMSPSNTHTQRYGINSSLIWNLNDAHSLRLAYTLDHARHRQTGAFGTIDFSNPTEPRFTNYFGGRNGETITNLDGYGLRSRDRLSYAILNQVAAEYRGRFFDDAVRISLGVRAPFFEREMNQNCYTQYSRNTVLCSSETPISNADGTVSFAGRNTTSGGVTAPTRYIAPYGRTVKFDDILPNLNVNWNIAGPHNVYASYAESLTLPRTDNLYTVFFNADGDITSPIADPEISKTFDAGYRYQTGTLIASANVWFTKFQNRILTTYDRDLDISVDRNVGDVDLYGFDAQVGYSPIEALSFYASASYNNSEISDDYLDGSTVIPVGGKSLVEVPEWTYVLSAKYETGPLSAGVQAKYVGARWLTDVNDLEVPSYTVVNADAKFDLGYFGVEGTYVQVNVINLLDEEYYGSLGTGLDSTRSLFASQGAPRTIQASVRYAF
ncbi:MAG: TonB-dependent receptor [Brevundimonas sp.]